MSEKAKQVAIDWVSKNESMINDVHNQIWELAEVGLQEVKTADILIDILEKNGFTVEKGVAGMPSAFVATWGQGKPVIGIMGELDALPGISQKKLPYKETLKEGAAGHGCGHHGYATAALGGAIAAKVAMEEGGIKGTVKCFGCPAEETLVGKVYMVRDGLFDGVDAALGHHPGAMNGTRLGSGNAMNSVKFEFYGRSSHAAGDPENGISAMDGVELNTLVAGTTCAPLSVSWVTSTIRGSLKLPTAPIRWLGLPTLLDSSQGSITVSRTRFSRKQ
jgi:aminobenzoyl-glutamate utilization protein B